jgi:hypothetical protein
MLKKSERKLSCELALQPLVRRKWSSWSSCVLGGGPLGASAVRLDDPPLCPEGAVQCKDRSE